MLREVAASPRPCGSASLRAGRRKTPLRYGLQPLRRGPREVKCNLLARFPAIYACLYVDPYFG